MIWERGIVWGLLSFGTSPERSANEKSFTQTSTEFETTTSTMIRPCPATILIAIPIFLCSNPDDATIIGITTLLFDLLPALDSDHDTHLDLRRSLQSLLDLQKQFHDTHTMEKELMGPSTRRLEWVLSQPFCRLPEGL